MPDPSLKKKPKTTYYVVAVTVGGVLSAFELQRLIRGVGGGESWFWLCVGGLMVALGMSGLFQKHPE